MLVLVRLDVVWVVPAFEGGGGGSHDGEDASEERRGELHFEV